MSLLLILGILILGLCGMPLFLVISALALIFYPGQKINPQDFIGEMNALTTNDYFIPIPMFTFAGYLMAKSKSPRRIVEAVNALFGWFPGGVAVVTLLTCAFFTTFTGASGVTIIALGGLLYPILIKQDYPENFSLGMMTSSGSLGAVFFPCLPVFIYALVIEQDPVDIFAAGFVPGMLSISVLAAYAVLTAKKRKIPRDRFDGKRALKASFNAAGEIGLPIFLVLGIIKGWFGVSDAAVLTVVYVFILEVVIFREINIKKDLPWISRESMKLVGAIFVIMGAALGMKNFIDTADVPIKMFNAMRGILVNKYVFLIFLNVFLLMVGCMMDIFSAILLVVPLIAPMAAKFGVDKFHLAIIFLVNLEIGYMTPPVGINLFIASFHFKKPVIQVYRAVVPYILLLLGALMVITYVPQLTLGPLNYFKRITGTAGKADLTKRLKKQDTKSLDDELKDMKKGKGKVDDDVDSGDLSTIKKKPKTKKKPKDLLKQLDNDDGLDEPKAPTPKKKPKDLLKQLDKDDDLNR